MLFLWLVALADEPIFEAPEEGASVEGVETHLTAELGGALSTGNVDFYVLSDSLQGDRRWGIHRVSALSGVLIGSTRLDSDGDGILSPAERENPRVRTAQRAFLDLRYDRFLGEKNSVYLLSGGFHDPYAGYDWRTHEQVGYSRLLVQSETTELVSELGLDLAQENYVERVDAGATRLVLSGRVMVGVEHTIGEDLQFSDTLEVYDSVRDRLDVRVLNTAAVTLRLSELLSLKFNHQLSYDKVPVRGYRPLDQTVTISVVATLL